MSDAERAGRRGLRYGIEFGVLLMLLLAGGVAGVTYIERRQDALLDPRHIHEGLALQAGALALQDGHDWLLAQPQQPVRGFSPGQPQAASLGRSKDVSQGVAPGLARRHILGEGLEAHTRLLPAGEGQSQALPGPAGRGWRLRCALQLFHDGKPMLSQLIEQDFCRLQLRLPAHAALYVRDALRLRVEEGAVLSGGSEGAGLACWRRGEQAPDGSRRSEPEAMLRGLHLLGELDGLPALAPVPRGGDSLREVFGAELAELHQLADQVCAPGRPLPQLQADRFYIHSGPLHVAPGEGLRGAGVLLVLGDLELLPGNESDFTGVLYVQGDLKAAAPCRFRGAVLATGAVTLQGDGDQSCFSFSATAVRNQARNLARYRRRGPARLTPR